MCTDYILLLHAMLYFVFDYFEIHNLSLMYFKKKLDLTLLQLGFVWLIKYIVLCMRGYKNQLVGG